MDQKQNILIYLSQTIAILLIIQIVGVRTLLVEQSSKFVWKTIEIVSYL